MFTLIGSAMLALSTFGLGYNANPRHKAWQTRTGNAALRMIQGGHR